MNNIKIFREESGMTIRKLSDKAKVATGYISTLENDIEGKSNPTMDIMVKISNALEKTVPDVFFPSGDSKEVS